MEESWWLPVLNVVWLDAPQPAPDAKVAERGVKMGIIVAISADMLIAEVAYGIAQ